MAENSSSRGLLTFIILLILVVVIGGAAYYASNGSQSANTLIAFDEGPSGYQAVFLNNSQVYFGKVSNFGQAFVTLEDIYYLQVNQVLQPIQGEDGQVTEQQVPDIQLVKLGGELHGPTDAMLINTDHILLIESLKEDSNVVTAIREFKRSQDDDADEETPATETED
ncbi:MAG: hypothetical protein Q8P45_02645 [Candidatus Harrisonbacteria bacterium]|nr:hypothetical protein [Candidatus Harrisonbacteria bacterium]